MRKELENILKQTTRSNFYYAFLFLPAKKRKALITIYKFCRITDDIVDFENPGKEAKVKLLTYWQSEFEKSLNSKSELEILNKVSRVIKEFKIPIEHFRELIKGVEMDLNSKRFSTFEELYKYCYRVASTVGLMSIEIFGYKNETTRDYAVNLGVAMQLTNILRDLKDDSKVGRFYLPQEDLIKYNYTEQELLNETYNDNFIRMMDFEASRAEKYYEAADRFLQTSDRKNLFSARAMQYIYMRLLKKMRNEKFNVFKGRIHLSRIQKIMIALSVWIKYKIVFR